MRVLLVVNPTASTVTTSHRAAVEEALRRDHDVAAVETRQRCHAVDLAREAAAGGLDAVVVFAGDGTVNEAANGLVGTSTALGVVPGGSTNVFARTIGMGRRPVAAAERLSAAMTAGSKRRIGLGLAGERYFLFHVGLGFDAAVVEQVERHASLKRALGQVVFAYCAVATWLCRYDRSRARFTIRTGPATGGGGDGDGPAPEAIGATFAICLNTNPYTYVGPRPLDVDPGTTLDSPLSLLAFRDIGLSTLGPVLASALVSGGRLADRPDVELRSGLHEITVEGHGPFPWQVDGDVAGRASALTLSYVPLCLDLFLPAGTPSGDTAVGTAGTTHTGAAGAAGET